ncbi:MAG: DUF5656 family protein [Candidatus Villigracilaceae bacterium]
MFKYKFSPDTNRLSVLTAAVLLALALSSVMDMQGSTRDVQLPGFYLPIGLNLRLVTILLAAGLTATGMDWLLRSHPRLAGKNTLTHWLLPTLTTLVISVPLYILPRGGLWWLVFGLGGVLLVLVFLAEYAIIDPSNVLYPAATAGLTALSLAMFLILAIALRYASARLVVLIPLLLPAAFLVSLRALYLYLPGQWKYAWSASAAIVCTQLAAGLHYWPLSPIRFGLILLGPLYALINLARNLEEGIALKRAVVEPAIILGLLWIVSLFLS